ncbi:response regulator [Paenibacillus doosanensis]|uniref:Response regulatory protein n=1 Tax=Paenibacillus konkukensis TaxID=2020716 RepID=A0ABY4RJR8_9BACL|nr:MULTISPECIES: response regulator [Paenibacillus]MCS7460049.1 response regulator [Paenibacillus doosanensis]UQZ82704.1 putative response regulatory protein [Paenibacillus konkukensis]
MNVMLVDDKESVVLGIRKHVPWGELGVDRVEIALDGVEALDKYASFPADLVITDIKMPNMNGIELMSRLQTEQRQIRFIVLSGYDEFDYAKQAISLGASEYVLKPVDIKELTTIIEKELSAIRKQLEMEEQRKQFQRKVQVSLPAMRQQYLTEMVLFRDHQPLRLQDKWNFAEIPVKPAHFGLLVFSIDRFAEISQQPVQEVELTRFIVENIIRDCLVSWGNGVAFYSEWGRHTLLVNYDPGKSEKEVKLQLLQFAEYCRTSIEQNSKITVTVGQSSLCPELKDLPDAYRQACEAIEHMSFFDMNQVIHYEDLSRYRLRGREYPMHAENELMSVVRRGQTELIPQAVDVFFTSLHSSECTPQETRLSCIQLAAVLYRQMLEMDIEGGLSDDFSRTWPGTFEDTSLADLRSRVFELCMASAQQVKLWIQNGTKNITEQVKQYVEEHLLQTITLPAVADHVGVSPNYLSSLFKKETGITFVEFITDRKLAQAKQWLADPHIPIYEVAERLRYHDRRYFREIFKKKTGMTPSGYRDHLLGTVTLDE